MERSGRMAGLVLPLAGGLVATCVLAAASTARSQAPEPALVIQGGSLIDVRRGVVVPGAAIVIAGNRIAEVGSVGRGAVPPGAASAWIQSRMLPMSSLPVTSSTRAESREKRLSTGPLIFPQGMSIGGSLGPHQWNATNPEEARWAARQNIEAGAAFLKVYGGATLEMVEAVVEEARRAGLNVTGHGGRTDARELALAGVKALAHGNGVPEATAPPEVAAQMKRRPGRVWYDQADPARFDDLVALLVERDVRCEPNLVQVYRGVYDQWDRFQPEFHRLSMHPVLHRKIDELFVRMWSTDFPGGVAYPCPPAEYEKRRKSLAHQQLFTRKFAAVGGKLMVGSDNYYHMAAG